MTDDEGKKNRQSPRFDVDWRVKLRCADWNAAQRVAAANVSRGGLFIATSKPPTVGARVELAIDLPDGSNLLLRGSCVHVRTPEQALQLQKSPGFGLRVDDAQMGDLLLLEEMARVVGHAHRRARAAAPVAAQPPARAAAPPRPPSPPPPRLPGRAAAADAPATLARVARTPRAGVREVVAPGVRTRREDAGARPHAAASPGAGPGRAARPPPAVAPPAPPAAAPAAGRAPAGRSPPQRPAAQPLRGAAPAVGIDFGTTYTRVAVYTADGVRLLADDEGRTMMPSIISYPDEGGCVVGWAAREQLVDRAAADHRLGQAPARPQRRPPRDPGAPRQLGRSAPRRGPGGQVLLRSAASRSPCRRCARPSSASACELAEQRLGTRVPQGRLQHAGHLRGRSSRPPSGARRMLAGRRGRRA